MSEPPITADQIPWGQQVNSTRDRSLKARIERSIKTGDELEPTDRHLAALLKLIDRDKDIMVTNDVKPEDKDLLELFVHALAL